MVVPEVTLNSGFQMPVLGFGTAPCPFPGSEAVKQAILCGIRNGYRHFDTASLYRSEQALGEAIAEAVSLGLIKSRDELFITSKLWCCDCHPERVLPALRNTLKNLQLNYLDLYLIHFPASSTPGKYQYPIPTEELFPMDFESVWAEMEKCQSLGLTKSIGVSNFSCKKIEDLLATAKIVPAVNQVEMNIIWHQGKLKEFCKMKNIIVTGYSPLGAMGTNWGNNKVMDCEVVNEIAKAKGKTHSQVCLRWIYEQGVTFVVKSFNEERMKQNMEIFDWELNKEENIQISLLPQSRCVPAEKFVSSQGPFKSLYELWDGEI